MAVFGFFIFLFLVVHPEDVGCSSPESVNRRVSSLKFFNFIKKVSGGGLLFVPLFWVLALGV